SLGGCAGACGLLPNAASTCSMISQGARPLHPVSSRIGSTTTGANVSARAGAAIPRQGPGEPPAKPAALQVRYPGRPLAAVPLKRCTDSCGPWRQCDTLSCEATPAECIHCGSFSPAERG